MSEFNFVPQGYPLLISRVDSEGRPTGPVRAIIGWRDSGREEPVAVLADGSEVSSILIAPNAHSVYEVYVS